MAFLRHFNCIWPQELEWNLAQLLFIFLYQLAICRGQRDTGAHNRRWRQFRKGIVQSQGGRRMVPSAGRRRRQLSRCHPMHIFSTWLLALFILFYFIFCFVLIDLADKETNRKGGQRKLDRFVGHQQKRSRIIIILLRNITKLGISVFVSFQTGDDNFSSGFICHWDWMKDAKEGRKEGRLRLLRGWAGRWDQRGAWHQPAAGLSCVKLERHARELAGSQGGRSTRNRWEDEQNSYRVGKKKQNIRMKIFFLLSLCLTTIFTHHPSRRVLCVRPPRRYINGVAVGLSYARHDGGQKRWRSGIERGGKNDTISAHAYGPVYSVWLLIGIRPHAAAAQ